MVSEQKWALLLCSMIKAHACSLRLLGFVVGVFLFLQRNEESGAFESSWLAVPGTARLLPVCKASCLSWERECGLGQCPSFTSSCEIISSSASEMGWFCKGAWQWCSEREPRLELVTSTPHNKRTGGTSGLLQVAFPTWWVIGIPMSFLDACLLPLRSRSMLTVLVHILLETSWSHGPWSL